MNLSPVAAALAIGVASPAPSHADTDAETRTKIIALSQELMDAVTDGRKDVWQRIAAADATVVDEFGRRQTARQVIDSLRPLPEGFAGSIEVRDPVVHVHGDTAVIVCEEYERETVFGQKFVVRYIDTNTFVRRDGAWKLVAMEDVTLPTEPPALAVDGLAVEDYPGTYRYGPGRAFEVGVEHGSLYYTTRSGGPRTALAPIARDVFMTGGDERNLAIFRRDASGHVIELIERRKFNDLHMARVATGG